MDEKKIKKAIGGIRKRSADCLELAGFAQDREDYLIYMGKADVLKIALNQLREAMN